MRTSKPPKSTTLPASDFRIRFLRVLKSHYTAERFILDILADETLKEQCATLLWLCTNDCGKRLENKERRAFWESLLADGIRGAAALAIIYRFDQKPHLSEYMATLNSDVLNKQRRLNRTF